MDFTFFVMVTQKPRLPANVPDILSHSLCLQGPKFKSIPNRLTTCHFFYSFLSSSNICMCLPLKLNTQPFLFFCFCLTIEVEISFVRVCPETCCSWRESEAPGGKLLQQSQDLCFLPLPAFVRSGD